MARPTSLNCFFGPPAAMVTVSPISKPSLSAVAASIETSSGPRGSRPLEMPMAANGFGM